MITHTPPVAGNLPVKKQAMANKYTYMQMHTYPGLHPRQEVATKWVIRSADRATNVDPEKGIRSHNNQTMTKPSPKQLR